jgi:arylformamidase
MSAYQGQYQSLSDADFIKHFMPRIAVPDHETWLSEDFATTAAVRARVAHRRNERYGPGPLQLLDLFPAKRPGSPVVAFIHGGYWRALSKDHYGFIAEPLVEAGAAVALMDYDLCPTVNLATVVDQVAASIDWLRARAPALNGDPDRFVIAGNSAGAHLAAMMTSRYGNDEASAGFIKGAVLVTGIYDLMPVTRIQVREDVHLTPQDIERLSPQHIEIAAAAPAIVAVGGDEPELWIDQSRRYHQKRLDHGLESEFMVLPGHHHFSVTRALAEPDSPLFRSMLRLLDR